MLQLEKMEGPQRLFRRQILYDPDGQASRLACLTPRLGSSLRLALATLLTESFNQDYLSRNTDERADGLYDGALNDPDIPMVSDLEVAQQCKSISDFDRYTLARDRPRAEQFFRWKKAAAKKARSRPLVVGDVVRAKTDAFSGLFQNPHPLIPLPSGTEEYLRAILRPPPPNLIGGSESFTLEIARVMKSFHRDEEASEAGNIATVCECRLVSVDGTPVPDDVPTLCVKILDDRLLNLDGLPKDERPGDLRRSLVLALTSEDLVRREDAAYRRLQHAQGSVVPHYFGCHLVSGGLLRLADSANEWATAYIAGWTSMLRACHRVHRRNRGAQCEPRGPFRRPTNLLRELL